MISKHFIIQLMHTT